MPRHPGTPVPSWPGTFCCGLQYSGRPSRAAATDKVHLTSPRRSTRNSQVRPPHGPPPGLHVRVAQIIHEQAKGDRHEFSVCTARCRKSISPPTLISLASVRLFVRFHLIRHWQSHPSLAPGCGNGAETNVISGPATWTNRNPSC